MQQPVETDQTKKTERDKKDAAAYRKMESDLHDVVNMGRIAAYLTNDADGKDDSEAGKALRGMSLFAVYHLDEMLRRFQEKYNEGGWLVGGTGGPS